MANSTDTSIENLAVTSACNAASNFIKHYYEYLEKSRHKLPCLYMANASLLWNGTSVQGAESIQRFYEASLPSCVFVVKCYDSQPVSARAVGKQESLLLTCSGHVMLKKTRRDFFQCFLISSQDDKWKIVSDNFRLQEVIST